MSARFEAPASYRLSAAHRGPLQLITDGWNEVWTRRRLIRYLVAADMKKKGADTLLGNLWWVLDPLLQMMVYVVLVSIIFSRPQPDYPLFIFAAILPWKWFTSSTQDAISSVAAQFNLVKQLKFPKIVLPTAAVGAGIVNFGFGLIALAGLLLVFYRDRISIELALIPLIAIVQLAFTLALAYAVSAVNVFYRDVGNLSRHVLRLWFYLSPSLWGASMIESLATSHPSFYTLVQLNPFYVLFTAYRDVIYYGVAPDWTGLLILFVISLGLIALSTLFFKRLEPSFAKVL
jgi:homopolymeric O-antigen transport system permease protein